MNKNVIIYLLFSFFVLILNWEMQHSMAVANFHSEVTEEDAIRLRILANSDSIKDQNLKREIRNDVNAVITEWVGELDSLEQAEQIISSRLAEIEAIVAQSLQNAGLNQAYTVEFDQVQFPTKVYGNLVYPAGYYDAVLITLGEGTGENWWCVLFPPLCFLDFANGDAIDHDEQQQDEKDDEIKVSFFIIEKITFLLDWFKK